MGLPYPGGPLIDKLARQGDPLAFTFSKANIKNLDYSFSGLKTSFLYFLRDRLKEDQDFVRNNLNDLCASIQHAIVESLIHKLAKAARDTGISEIAITGGVSANSGLREAVYSLGTRKNWNVYIPELQYSTDNAAMIAISGYYKYLRGQFSSLGLTPVARFDHL
jgi:N6-L-threonylcarbamoyladenine synthase